MPGMRSFTTWTAIGLFLAPCVAQADVTIQSESQTLEQAGTSVLMRRPLPTSGRGDVPSEQPGGPGGTGPTEPGDPDVPGQPEDPPAPGDGSCDPSKTICVGPVVPGPEAEDPGDDPDGVDYYEWAFVPGPWSGGGQCGRVATLTRQVQCVRTSFRYSESDGIKCVGDKRDSYGNCQGNSFPVPDSQCVDYGLSRPASSVTTTGANCGYTLTRSYGEWSSTCSTSAYRDLEYSCTRDSDGAKVSNEYCRMNLDAGSTEVEMPSYETKPVYDGCDASKVRWNPSEEDSYDCEGKSQRPVYLSYTCQSRGYDGEWYDDADEACSVLAKPTQNVRYEACWYGFKYEGYNARRSACVSGMGSFPQYTGGVTAYLVKGSTSYDEQGFSTGNWVDADGNPLGSNIAEIVDRTCKAGASACCEMQTWDYQGFDRTKYDRLVAVWTYDAATTYQAPSGLVRQSVVGAKAEYHPYKPY